jgi:hypothetical protein
VGGGGVGGGNNNRRVFARLMDKAHPLVWHWMRWNMASGDALLDIHRKTRLLCLP